LLHGDRSGFRAVGHVELLGDVVDVVSNRMLADAKGLPDFFVRQTS
jgi:hypothetical protein